MSDKRRPLSPDDFFTDPIQIMWGLDPVRWRPSLYVGATDDGTGLHNLVFVVDDALAQAGADRVAVTLNRDGSVTISDNGAADPLERDPATGVSAIETRLTILESQARGRRTGQASVLEPPGILEPPRYDGPPGLGDTARISVAFVNVLSEQFGLRIWHAGQAYAIDFAHGDPVAPLRCTGDSQGRAGREVTFRPAAGSFPHPHFDHDVLAAGLAERGRPDLSLSLVDARRGPD